MAEEFNIATKQFENWKYTDLARLLAGISFNETEAGSQPQIAKTDDHYYVVFYAGSLITELSDIDALPVISSAPNKLTLDLQNHPLAKSAQQKAKAGINLKISKSLKKPIHLVYLLSAENLASHYQHQIEISNNSTATIIEETIGTTQKAELINSSMQIEIKSGELWHVQHQARAAGVKRFNFIHANLAKDSELNCFHSALGADLERYDLIANLNAQGASCSSHGLYSIKAKQHCDNHILFNHNASHTQSKQNFRGIIDEQAHAVFNGKAKIIKDIGQIKAEQFNHNLLLSSQAEVDTKPELEIYSDDVACSHGATIGELDKNAMFYLQSRGIPAEKARDMLLHAFVHEPLEPLPKAMRNWVQKRID